MIYKYFYALEKFNVNLNDVADAQKCSFEHSDGHVTVIVMVTFFEH